MEQLEIDDRSINDIIEQIREKAEAYTPEWRFDPSNRDAGTALALIYAEMIKSTISRLNLVPEKNRIAFYNKLGASLKPASPAEGYVTFGLVSDEVAGSYVTEKTQLFADTESGDSVVFETEENFYVTSSKIVKIYSVNKKGDYIAQIYDSEKDSLNDCKLEIYSCNGTNLQTHSFTITHPSVFHILTEGEIILNLKMSKNSGLTEDMKKDLLNPQNVRFEYLTADGFKRFADVKLEGDSLILKKSKDMAAFDSSALELPEDGEGMDYIRCMATNIRILKDIQLEALYIRSRGKAIPPELLVAAENEYKDAKCYAFGERPSLMQELYFISEEVLSKKGASIHLSFDLEYGSFELENSSVPPEYNWKNIMKKSEFEVDKEYDITISEVVWEYYNGIGWTRLFSTDMYADIFNAQNGDFSTITVNFQCPEDIAPFLVNSVTSYSIRARILKMNNIYKMKGKYISPCISRVKFKYEYINNHIMPMQITICNNLGTSVIETRKAEAASSFIRVFCEVEDENPGIYLGFDKPIMDGPVKIMFQTQEAGYKTLPIQEYEYWAKDHWKNLNLIDATENFRKSGIVTIMGNDDFSHRTLFGEDLYWIRISDVNDEYRFRENVPPVLTGIYMNTVPVKAVETMEPEYFDIRPNEENLVCRLSGGNIHQIEVWVDEISEIGGNCSALTECGCEVNYEYNAEGELTNAWVKWKEVPEFERTYMDDRVYTVDLINGIVRFSDGRNGKIPPSAGEATIRIQYICGGGLVGNVEPLKINRLNRTIGFIGDVGNFDSTMGGCDHETIEEAVKRKALSLRHGYRAVTATDYENLAMEADRTIVKAKCCSNYNIQGEQEYGYVTLVILQRDYEVGHKFFDHSRRRVEEYLKFRMNEVLLCQKRFAVIEPEYAVINVNITAVVRDYNKAFEIKRRIDHCIKNFLDPIKGNFDHKGWNIGECPNENQIQNAVRDIREVVYIKNVRIDAYQQNSDGRIEIDYDKLKVRPFVLPVNGEHKIIIDVE